MPYFVDRSDPAFAQKRHNAMRQELDHLLAPLGEYERIDAVDYLLEQVRGGHIKGNFFYFQYPGEEEPCGCMLGHFVAHVFNTYDDAEDMLGTLIGENMDTPADLSTWEIQRWVGEHAPDLRQAVQSYPLWPDVLGIDGSELAVPEDDDSPMLVSEYMVFDVRPGDTPATSENLREVERVLTSWRAEHVR